MTRSEYIQECLRAHHDFLWRHTPRNVIWRYHRTKHGALQGVVLLVHSGDQLYCGWSRCCTKTSPVVVVQQQKNGLPLRRVVHKQTGDTFNKTIALYRAEDRLVLVGRSNQPLLSNIMSDPEHPLPHDMRNLIKTFCWSGLIYFKMVPREAVPLQMSRSRKQRQLTLSLSEKDWQTLRQQAKQLATVPAPPSQQIINEKMHDLAVVYLQNSLYNTSPTEGAP